MTRKPMLKDARHVYAVDAPLQPREEFTVKRLALRRAAELSCVMKRAKVLEWQRDKWVLVQEFSNGLPFAPTVEQAVAQGFGSDSLKPAPHPDTVRLEAPATSSGEQRRIGRPNLAVGW